MSSEETRRIVQGALEGDASALPALLERIRPRVVLWAATHLTGHLKAREDPEDLAQRILFKVYERCSTLETRDERAFFQWVWQIGRNEIIDLHRYYEARKRGDGAEVGDEPLLLEPAPISSPSSRVGRGELAALVREAVAQLPAEMQDVFRLCKLEGRSAEEAGAEMGRTANATRVLLCRTLRRLRDSLGGIAATTGAS